MNTRNLPSASYILLLTVSFLTVSLFAQDNSIDKLIDQELPSLINTYKTIHTNPELSGHEKNTSALVAKELKALGYTVTEGVGKYDNPNLTCYGVVGILKNGNGPNVLVRADMDALPVEEMTRLPYASRVKVKNDAGQEVNVMHACGHDIHVSSFLGTAKLLTQLKDKWHGTVILVGQPAEEIGAGAKAMVNDGLYTRFPKPDYVLALHSWAGPAGTVAFIPEYFNASTTFVDLTIRGIGGHGAKPETAKDPIVIAAQTVLALQTIVSRENSPLDPAVVTVGSIHGGTKHNIIPDEVQLQITVRAYKEEVRKKMVSSIERIAKGIALAAGVPEELAPIIKIGVIIPAAYNNIALTDRLSNLFIKTLGKDHVEKIRPAMISEDFSFYSLDDHSIPGFYFYVGVYDSARVSESRKSGTPLPDIHSSMFAPVPDLTLRTGIKAMTSAVLDLMK